MQILYGEETIEYIKILHYILDAYRNKESIGGLIFGYYFLSSPIWDTQVIL